MSELERGAERVEQRVRARAEEAGLAMTELGWNGEEGLRSELDIQTLFVSTAGATMRLALATEQVVACAEGGVGPNVDALIEETLRNAEVGWYDGDSPLGGGG